ncbi:beta-lyase [Chryseobacterium lactis]|uniref:Aminotransferase class I/II-fold pyridoxal phosphate-dependent enzyme n=1 Tax=Chryseobacterium lactis TaxID=1241981 RepID=A0A3G6RZ81_CHRLC|nr:aminotransferase class I/II-fold pyridoxal phosphate-dependent enzyme [Chryseobacterium lactis]AZA85196.1 aminotransferase class I/II-fold pyridoxal phosphate-dependent enzyme [Chryseobacterium lactis]AZB07146.1 aminotransferase class I/II-fold pyridoxal phosphate-dependent enzyme [Chryseobacterium lactis]PNW11735.1 beta-lyase [Chryseobacterium lactis]
MKRINSFTHYSFFTEMSELAQRHGSFDLSLGLPDFDIDERLRLFLKESADLDTHHYEPLSGNPLLIENIIRFNAKRENSIFLTRQEVTVVPCATFALHTALKSVLNQGDEVIIIQPSYYTYAPSVVMNGGVPVYCDLDDNFLINWENLESCISEKTKAIIINSPQNPTGKIWKQSDWNTLYELIKNQEIYLISEEIYDMYCYDGVEHYSSFIHPGLKDRTFCIFSFGKMFHTSGWKVSYMLASKDLTSLFQCHQQYISYSANAPAQYALARYLEVFDPSVNKEMMQRKRNIFNELIKDTPLEVEQQAEGSVFQIVNFRNISKTMTDVEFSKWLTIEKKVACLPLSAFYNERQDSDYIRFSFAKKDELIIQALEHLRKNL